MQQSNKIDGTREKAAKLMEHFTNVMMKVTEKERMKLHSYRRKEEFDDEIIWLIENRLDLEEERLQEDVE